MDRKLRVMVVNAFYLPGYKAGGPIRSLAGLVGALGKTFEFKVLAKDRDTFDTEPYPSVRAGSWNSVGDATVFYIPPGLPGLWALFRVLMKGDYDVLYLNSFFGLQWSALPMIAYRLGLLPRKPLVLAPRGEFSSGALELKPLRKRVFISVVKALSIYRDVLWHASSAHEAEDIRRVFADKTLSIRIASDMPDSVASFPNSANLRSTFELGVLRVIFVSRITPKKNLLFALRVLRQVRSRIQFDIYGPIPDTSYWQKCELAISKLPDHIHCRRFPEVKNAEIVPLFQRYDLFLFPTAGENYGHVIVESLAAGTPVLLSDQTMWTDLESEGAGWIRPLSSEIGFSTVIDEYATSEEGVQRNKRSLARRYFDKRVLGGEIIKANEAVFASLDVAGLANESQEG